MADRAAGPGERKKVLLRLDPAVYAAVAKWAADDLRSVNAQIEFALRLALRSVGRVGVEPKASDAAGKQGRAPRAPK